MALLVLLSFFASLFLCCLCFPSLCTAITGGDDFFDAHEAGLAVVASRTPFRESGPPACMAKLIMLRHKIHQDNTRRRGSSKARRGARAFTVAPVPTPPRKQLRNIPWAAVRFNRGQCKQNY